MRHLVVRVNNCIAFGHRVCCRGGGSVSRVAEGTAGQKIKEEAEMTLLFGFHFPKMAFVSMNATHSDSGKCFVGSFPNINKSEILFELYFMMKSVASCVPASICVFLYFPESQHDNLN